MEEIPQLIFEVLFQFVFEVLGDVVWRRLPEPARAAFKTFCVLLFGAALGFVSTLFVSEPLIESRTLAIVHLVVGPIFVGWLMVRIGSFLEKRDRPRSALERFGHGWLFALSFSLVRFVVTR